MKLFIDEDLTPRLVETCNDHNYYATSVRDRDRLSTKDHVHAQFAFDEDWVFVTNNAGDFEKLARQRGLHPGLVFIEEGTIAEEQEWMACALAHIRERAAQEGEAEADFMINRVVAVDESGQCEDYPFP